MIKILWIDNFKSLVDLRLEFDKFNCLIGLNGSGKSTVLQAMDFMSQLLHGDIDGWLKNRHWEHGDLNSKLTKKSNIDFRVELDVEGKDVIWTGSFNRSSLSCTKESLIVDGKKVGSVEDGFYTRDATRSDIVFKYQGSIFSVLKDGRRASLIPSFKEAIIGINSLDLISPELLRSQNRKAEKKLGLGGENLSAFIHESGESAKVRLKKNLVKIYPQLEEISTKSLRSGWKKLEIKEKYSEFNLTSNARHVNDGMLRLMAILVQLEIKNSFHMFDEIENGINPELIEFLVDYLVNCDDQIMVTTHSPMVLNFMDDEVAMKGVIYLYKNAKGHTQAIRFFDIPSMAKKLELMGPGEAFIDTDLTRLHEEITALQQQEEN